MKKIKYIFNAIMMPLFYIILQFLWMFIIMVFVGKTFSADILFNLFVMTYAGFICLLLYRKNKEDIIPKELNTKKSFMFFGIGILINTIIMSIIYLLIFLFKNNVGFVNIMNDYISTTSYTGLSLASVLFSTGLFVPLAEEIIFRHLIMKNLNNINTTFSIIFSAAMFGLLHLNIVQSTYTFIFGLILGYIYNKYKNLYYCFFMHLGFNIMGILIYIFL